MLLLRLVNFRKDLGAVVFYKLVIPVFKRAFGSLLYAFVAIFALPSDVVIKSIFLLGVFEFLFGMLMPTLRVSVLSNRIDLSEARFILSASFFVSAAFCCFAGGPVFAIFILLSASLLLPKILYSLVKVEQRDVDCAIKLDALSAMIGSFFASGLLVSFNLFGVSDALATPLVRGGAVVFVQYFFLHKICARVSLFEWRAKGISGLKAVAGVDYLAAFSFLRVNFLSAFSKFDQMSDLVKLTVILYDPLASFVGYFLRIKFKKSGFAKQGYFFETRYFFLIGFGLVIFGVVAYQYTAQVFFVALSLIFILLLLAAATTHALLIGDRFRLLLIFFLLSGPCALYFNVNILYSVMGVALFFMIFFLFATKGGAK